MRKKNMINFKLFDNICIQTQQHETRELESLKNGCIIMYVIYLNVPIIQRI